MISKIPAALRSRLVAASAGGAIAVAMTLTGWFEGREHAPYRDPGGVWTVCDGHTGADVVPGLVYTDAECDAFHHQDVTAADAGVSQQIHVPLNPWQRAALIDFVFNLGEGRLATSTMRRYFNAGDYTAGCDELLAWVNGRVAGRLRPLPGLVDRRNITNELCLRGLS